MIMQDSHTDSDLKKFYSMKNIAVVGMSGTEGKAANYVPQYMIEQGYNIIPVNPNSPQIMSRRSYQTTSAIPENVQIVNVFRPSKDVPDVVKDALKKDGVKLIWMQEGIYSKEAEDLALARGIDVVYNRCMMVEHKRLFGD